MRLLIKSIPSIITSLNLICGALSIIFAFNAEFELSILLVICASIFDFFDGFAARLLKAVSEFGKQLDSLADLISFGLAPTIILYNLFVLKNPEFEYLAFSTILIVVFSALRLAKFNIDTEQSIEFKGLPTPASALLIISISYYSIENKDIISDFLTNPYILTAISVIVSLLMVSNIKMFSLKIKSFKSKEIIWPIILVIGATILLIIFNYLGIGLTIILYLAISIIKQLFINKKL